MKRAGVKMGMIMKNSRLAAWLPGIMAAVLMSAGCTDRMVEEIERVTDSIDARVGVAVIGDGGRTAFSVNDGAYPMMSVFKFHQALAVAGWLEKNGRDMDMEVFVSKDDLKENTWSPLRERYPEGCVSLPVRELLVIHCR